MTETYYRLHTNPDAPTFSPENAWSAPWGAEWNQDGTKTRCTRCLPGEQDCPTCGGTGWDDASYGYSACESAADLIAYATEHMIVGDNDAVVIFEGERVGTGFDGEPLAIPTGQARWTTWAELAVA
jgi:hypothetical protein